MSFGTNRRAVSAAVILAALAGPVPAYGAAAGEREFLPAPGDFVRVEELPVVLEQALPGYPPAALKAGVHGTVLVQALIGPDGLVRDTRVSKSIPMLDSAAIDCVRRWRFSPGRANGRPIAVWVAVPVRFPIGNVGAPPSAAPPADPGRGRPGRGRAIDPEKLRKLPVRELLELLHPVWPPERGLAPGPLFEHPTWPPEWSEADSLVRLLGIRPGARPRGRP